MKKILLLIFIVLISFSISACKDDVYGWNEEFKGYYVLLDSYTTFDNTQGIYVLREKVAYKYEDIQLVEFATEEVGMQYVYYYDDIYPFFYLVNPKKVETLYRSGSGGYVRYIRAEYITTLKLEKGD